VPYPTENVHFAAGLAVNEDEHDRRLGGASRFFQCRSAERDPQDPPPA